MATKIEITTLLTACLTAAAAIGGFGYYIGRDTASSEVSQLTRENEWLKSAQGVENALDYLSDLSTYNENLFEFSKHKEQIAEKEAEIEALNNTINQMKNDAQNLRISLVSSREALANTQAEVVNLTERLSLKYDLKESASLSEGQSHVILEGAAILGVQSLYDSRAVITLENESKFIDVGEAIEFQVENAQCMVALRETLTGEVANFDVRCRLQLN